MSEQTITIDTEIHTVVSRELIKQALLSLWDYRNGAPFGRFDRDCIAELEGLAWPNRNTGIRETRTKIPDGVTRVRNAVTGEYVDFDPAVPDSVISDERHSQ